VLNAHEPNQNFNYAVVINESNHTGVYQPMGRHEAYDIVFSLKLHGHHVKTTLELSVFMALHVARISRNFLQDVTTIGIGTRRRREGRIYGVMQVWRRGHRSTGDRQRRRVDWRGA